MLYKDYIWRCRSKRPINHSDIFNMLNLYQPVIGPLAVSLYLTYFYHLPLNQAGISCFYNLSYLLKLMATTYDKLAKARNILEAVGLLTCYELIENEKYDFLLLPPLSPPKFFQSDVLCFSLCKVLGKERFFLLRKKLVDDYIVEPKGKDVTKSFQAVFGKLTPFDFKQDLVVFKECGLALTKDVDKYEDGKYPYVDFKDLAWVKAKISNFVSEDVWTKDLEDKIRELAFLYKLTDEDILKALQNPNVTRDGTIDIENLRSFLKSQYSFSLQDVACKEEKKKEVIFNLSKEELKHIEQLENLSPLQLLSFYQSGSKVALTDIELVDSLSHNFKLPNEVINVLLEYVLLKYDYKLPRNLVEKIAAHWKRLGIKTAKEAFIQAKSQVLYTKKQKKRKNNLNKDVSLKLPKSMYEQQEALTMDEIAVTKNIEEDMKVKELKLRLQDKINKMQDILKKGTNLEEK